MSLTPRGSVLSRTLRGAGWVVAWRWGMRLLGLANTLVLVRLLAPADFGLVALATSFMNTIDAMMMLGTEEAVIRQKDPNRTVYDTAFTLNVMRGLTVSLVVLAVAEPAARFFGDPRLAVVLFVVAPLPLLDGLSNIGTVDFRRRLEFHKEFAIMVLPKLMGIIATIAAALIRPDYTALLYGVMANHVMRSVMSYVMHPFRPRVSLREWRVLIGYSAWTWALSLAQLVRNRIDTLMLGRLATPRSVGLYSVGAELAALPTTELVDPLCRASFAGFAVARNAGMPVNETVLRLIGMASVVTLPAGMGLSLVAEPLVRIAFGHAWMDAVPVLQILGVAGTITVCGHITHHLMSAYGLLGRLTAVATAGAALRVALLFGLIPLLGVTGAAAATGVAMCLEQTVTIAMGLRHFGIGLGAFTGQVWRPLLATSAMTLTLVVTGLGWAHHSTASPAILLAVAVTAGAAIYAVVLLGTWILAGRPAGVEADALAAIRRLVAA